MTMTTDPSGLTGSIATVAGAALALLVAFGIPLSDEQIKAILGFLVVAGPVITALTIRHRAFAPSTVEALLAGETTPALVGLDNAKVAVIPAGDKAALEAALLEETDTPGQPAEDPYPDGVPEDLDAPIIPDR